MGLYIELHDIPTYNSLCVNTVIVLIIWLARVAGIHEYLLPFPYLHMITLIFTYDIMDGTALLSQ